MYEQTLSDIPAEEPTPVSFFLARTATEDMTQMNDHTREMGNRQLDLGMHPLRPDEISKIRTFAQPFDNRRPDSGEFIQV
ncbi:hypothetical protein N7517_005261 [Penicillium concentricum]|uniref:Uncharacterized protein n=1 Tax=Penicillium concentricum TaxID=293559 RepID=A0A9W9VBA8_9EURO|nr:uncharacterized protein N7517_005261 [Penicillium concentricum]KAJ5373255.1 hypothetical protein N7517_005261 [Penicillium concentricum]